MNSFFFITAGAQLKGINTLQTIYNMLYNYIFDIQNAKILEYDYEVR